jgi:pimeloyl-ACP methyl ester carboxylesterase
LVDPSVEYQALRMGGDASAFAPMIARARAAGNLQQASELETLSGLSSDQVAQTGPVAVPMIVLTAGASQGNPAAQARWAALHRAIGGEQRVAAGAPHMIPRDDPELIVRTAGELLDRLSAAPRP